VPRSTPDPLFCAFGAAVRGLREARGLSQEALAEKAELQRTYLVDVEAGRCNVTLRNLARLALALEVPLGELLARTDAGLPRS
jgi:transcriptional regulator with XRE-family HTH domain